MFSSNQPQKSINYGSFNEKTETKRIPLLSPYDSHFSINEGPKAQTFDPSLETKYEFKATAPISRMPPKQENMDEKTVALHRDYIWRKVPSLESHYCCTSSHSTIGACATYAMCSFCYEDNDDLMKCRFFGPSPTAYLQNDTFHVNMLPYARVEKCCLSPVNGMYSCCYSHFGNTEKNNSCSDHCLDMTCATFVCTLDGLYKIITYPFGWCAIVTVGCIECSRYICCCMSERSPLITTTLKTSASIKYHLKKKNLLAIFNIILKSTSFIRDEIISLHGKDILCEVLQDKELLTLDQKKQLICFISERQLPFLYHLELLPLALLNTSPEAMEILKFFLNENNFGRFANRELLEGIDFILFDKYKNGTLTIKQLVDRIKLLKQHGILFNGQCNLFESYRNSALGFFREKPGFTDELVDIITEYFLPEQPIQTV